MKNYIFFLFIWLLCFDKALAKVELAVEPYLGYSELSLTTNGFTEKKMAAVLGGKGGLEIDKIFLALDFHFGGPYLLEDNNNDYTNYMWGLGAAYDFKKARIFAGYYFTNVLDDIERNIRYTGSAYKFSMGLNFESKLSFNVDVVLQNYNKIEGLGSLGNSIPFSYQGKVVFFSISAPLSIK
ncbi:MAG: hypothetical protein H6625_14055 [Bdellovibrionaceae bacterium]|nr:hypothetical protein [Pseudobdellovibrionaceae bacterium]